MSFNRALIVMKSYLGDTVMASPLVRGVAKHSKAMDIFGSPIVEPILRYPDFRIRVHDPGDLSRLPQLWKAAMQVRQGHYDIAFVVNRSFRSALLVRLAGIKARVGHTTEGRGFLLNERVPYESEKNEAECYLDLLSATGHSFDLDERLPSLWISPEEKVIASQLLEGGSIGIQPGARHEYKQIPTHVLREVGQGLIDRGHKLVFVGGPEEEPAVQALGLPGVSLVGKTSLRESMAVLANLKLVIGGDTGVWALLRLPFLAQLLRANGAGSAPLIKS